ncbi:MAG: hypothetical protein ACYS1A_18775, partial [Planctomycetota bacterium]
MANALATSIVEFRSGGDNTNGGFYDTAAGTTDYSQQDAAQLSLSDLTTDGAGTGLGSATGGFTAQMVGNSIYIASGTGFTPGFYRVTAYTSSNLVTIDRSAGVGASAGVGKLGGGLQYFTDAFLETEIVNDMTIWVKAGGMTLTEHLVIAADGGINNVRTIEGYNTTRGDNPTGDNRPLIT